MATFIVYGQTILASEETIASDGSYGFFGTLWDDGITITEYQDSTHAETNVPGDQCGSDHLHNTKWSTDSTHVRLDGGSEVLLSTLGDGDVPIKINFSDASLVETLDAEIFAYDGTTESTGPVNITFQVAEAGESTWVNADGSGSKNTTIADHGTPATSHDFYFAASVAPGVAGLLADFTIKFLLYYQ